MKKVLIGLLFITFVIILGFFILLEERISDINEENKKLEVEIKKLNDESSAVENDNQEYEERIKTIKEEKESILKEVQEWEEKKENLKKALS